MYAGSAAFAEAIRDRRPQHALALFPSFCLTDEDIAADGGISYSEWMNTDEDLTMGKAVQSEVSVTLINRDGFLSDVDFTKAFTLSLGVETSDERVYHSVPSGYDLAIIMDTTGLRALVYASTKSTGIVCGTAAYATSEVPCALLAHGRKLYVAGESGLIAYYELLDNGTLRALTLPAINGVMVSKFRRWAKQRRCACLEGNVVYEYSDINYGYTTWGDFLALTWAQVRGRTWGSYLATMRRVSTEYSPLGIFNGERPERLRTRLIDLRAYDNMAKFEVEAEGFFDSLTYPITLRAYFEALCAYCGVSVAPISRFVNGDKVFASAPIDTNGLTCRDVLAYLAEATCSYARMTRDGACELAWYTDTGYGVYKTDRFALDRAEYEVMPIDRTQVKVTESDIGVLVGEGDNGYAIVDCPFLYGMSDADVRPWAQNIHNELVQIAAYSPMTVDAECDWRVQCGDIITVEEDDGTLYQTPVFVQTITWNGHANVTYESTGRMRREEMTQQHREQIRTGRAWYEIQKTIEGLVSSVGKVENLEDRVVQCESTVNQSAEAITTAVTKSEEAIETANGLETRLSSAEEKVTADAIVTTVRSSTSYQSDMSGKVGNNEVISSINQTAESIKIKANRIEFDGAVITNGTLTTGNWTFDSNGAKYRNGSIGVNMTVLTGGNFAGGGTSTRAFYGSSNCDVQYGADYGYKTFIRSKAITIVAHNNGDMSDTRMATFSKYPGPKDYEDFTFYCEEADEDSPAGNLGYAEQPWDTIYVNKCFRLSEGTFSSRHVKHDIADLPEMGEMLDRLRPVSFKYNYKHVANQERYGLILEEAVDVIPAICSVPTYNEGTPEYISEATISYVDLIAPMLKEIQSLRKRMARLEGSAA